VGQVEAREGIAMPTVIDEMVDDVAEVLRAEDMASLAPGDVRRIIALLRAPTRAEAAQLAGCGRATLYRRLRDPAFKAALRKAELLALQEAAWAER
jgi:hypothetical protein